METITLILFLLTIGMGILTFAYKRRSIPLTTLTIVCSLGGLALTLTDAGITDETTIWVMVLTEFAVFMFTVAGMVTGVGNYKQ